MHYKTGTSKSVWEDLRHGSQVEQGISIPTIPYHVDTGQGAIRHALGPDGEPRLLLPISMHEKLPDFRDSPGLTVREATYSQSGRPVRFLDVICRIPELETVFSEVAHELMERIRKGSPCATALLSTLQDFRALLLAAAEKEVSDEKILGLAGELLFLEKLLKLDSSAWVTWRGPLGDRHDFRYGSASMEVKTGSRRSASHITVSSVDQLAPPKGGLLFIAHVVLEKTSSGELDICRLAERVMGQSDNPSEIKKLLEAAACQNPAAEAWNRLSFNFESETFYSVTEGFPVITPESFAAGSLPYGIESLTYVVDLTHAEQFRVKGQELNTLVAEFVK